MPWGTIINVAAVFVGGVIGCLIGSRLPDKWKSLLQGLFGISAITMGIVLILRVSALSAVILSLLLGGIVGELLGLEKRVNKLVIGITEKLLGSTADEAYLMQIATVMVLFCFSGTGWYGALYEGMTGDGSILITKAILDGVTALIFATMLGKLVPLLAVPQLIIMLALFFLSGLVSPLISDSMIADFSAIGGIITLAAGLRLTKIKTDISILNLLPALPLSFLISALWTVLVG